MSTLKKNLRVCQVLHATKYYDIIVAVDTLDEIDNILQDWALENLDELLDLPEDLVYNKDITEVITTLDIDNFAYLQSAVSSYMDMPRYAGLSNEAVTFPTTLTNGLYVMPEVYAYLYSEAEFQGYFGEYIVPEVGLSLVEGLNFICIRFNLGVPEYINYPTTASIDYSSIIPVLTVISFAGSLYLIPFGKTGYGLPEMLLQNHLTPEIVGAFTLETDGSNYIQLSELTAKRGILEKVCEACDTSGADDLYLYYKDGSLNWQKSAKTTINNTQYQQSAGALGTLGAGDFVVNYIYRLISDTDKMLFIVLSDSFDSLAAAKESENVYDIPDVLENTAVLVGRMIVEQASVAPVVQKVQRVWFGTC